MKKLFHERLILAAISMVLLGLFCGLDQGSADDRGFGYSAPQITPTAAPILVQFVGTFYAPEHKDKAAGMNTLTVSINNQKWFFRIKNAIDLSGDRSELAILSDIWPPVLAFRGTENLIDLLQKPDIEGKMYSIRGHLYFSSRVFTLESVQEVGGKKDTRK